MTAASRSPRCCGPRAIAPTWRASGTSACTTKRAGRSSAALTATTASSREPRVTCAPPGCAGSRSTTSNSLRPPSPAITRPTPSPTSPCRPSVSIKATRRFSSTSPSTRRTGRCTRGRKTSRNSWGNIAPAGMPCAPRGTRGCSPSASSAKTGRSPRATTARAPGTRLPTSKKRGSTTAWPSMPRRCIAWIGTSAASPPPCAKAGSSTTRSSFSSPTTAAAPSPSPTSAACRKPRSMTPRFPAAFPTAPAGPTSQTPRSANSNPA